MNTAPEKLNGACLCGAVAFEIEAPFRDVVICHCTQCAKWTGHQVAATSVGNDRLRFLTGEKVVQWFRSSDNARRGFCRTCGSSLFWRPDAEARTSIMAGVLDDPTGLQVGAHIFTGDQRGYMATSENAPRFVAAGNDAPVTPGTKVAEND